MKLVRMPIKLFCTILANLATENPLNFLTDIPTEPSPVDGIISSANTPKASQPDLESFQPPLSLFSPKTGGPSSFETRSPQFHNTVSPSNISNTFQSNTFQNRQNRRSEGLNTLSDQNDTTGQISPSQLMRQSPSSFSSPADGQASVNPMRADRNLSISSSTQRFFNGMNKSNTSDLNNDSLNGDNSEKPISGSAIGSYQMMLQQEQHRLSDRRDSSNYNTPNGSNSRASSPVIRTSGQAPQPNQLSNTNNMSGRINLANLSPQDLATLKKKLQLMSPQQQVAFHRQLANFQQGIQNSNNIASQQSSQQSSQQPSRQSSQQSSQQPSQQSSQPLFQQSPQQLSQQSSQQLTKQQLLQRQLAQQQQRAKQQYQLIEQKRQELLGQAKAQQQKAQEICPQASSNQPPTLAGSASKFFKSILDFMQGRGTPIKSMPVICGRTVHLIALYGIVVRLGGFSKIQETHSWHVVASKLGFNPKTDISASQELARAFVNLLLPFDEFMKNRQARQDNASQVLQQQQQSTNNLSTPNPSTISKPSAQITPQISENLSDLQYQKQLKEQLRERILEKQRAQRSQDNLGATRSHISPSPQSSNSNLVSSTPSINQNVGSQAQGSRNQTPDPSQQPTFFNQSVRPESNSSPILRNRSATNSIDDTTKSYMLPPRQVAISPSSMQRKRSASSQDTKISTTPKPLLNLSKQDGKYLPKKRKFDATGGYDIKELAQLSTNAGLLAPDFPLFLEIGAVEINSLIMALKSMIPGEVRQALDKLALLSSNPNVPIVLQECPGLLTALGTLGLDIMNNLKSEKDENTVDVLSQFENTTEATEDSEEDLIASVFNTYRNWDTSNEEVVIKIDSLTGEPIENVQDNAEAIGMLDSIIAADDQDFLIDKSLSELKPSQSPRKQDNNSYYGYSCYRELLEFSKEEMESLHQERRCQLYTFWKDAIVDRFLCITMILRNLSFTETNQSCMVRDSAVFKFLFKSIRALGDNSNLVFSNRRRLCLQKDLITLLANLGLYISIPSPADAFSILLLTLSFSPEESPFKKDKTEDSNETVMFAEYSPTAHRYLGCAMDAFAKLIPRDPPNRGYFEDILLNTCTDEEYLSLLERHLQGRKMKPYEFLTRTFALAISTVPRGDFHGASKALESRKPLLQQSLLIAEHLAMMIPSFQAHNEIIAGMSAEYTCPSVYMEVYNDLLCRQSECNLALDWLEAAEGFGSTLLRAACSLDGIFDKSRSLNNDKLSPWAKIAQRCVGILHTLGQKAMSFEVIAKSTSNTGVSSIYDINKTTPEVDSSISVKQEQELPLNKTSAHKEGENITPNLSENGPISKISFKMPVGVFPSMEALLSMMLAGNTNEKIISHLCAISEEGSNFVSTMQQLRNETS